MHPHSLTLALTLSLALTLTTDATSLSPFTLALALTPTPTPTPTPTLALTRCNLRQKFEWVLQEEPLFSLVHAAAFNGQEKVLPARVLPLPLPLPLPLTLTRCYATCASTTRPPSFASSTPPVHALSSITCSKCLLPPYTPIHTPSHTLTHPHTPSHTLTHPHTPSNIPSLQAPTRCT